jgi:ubiquinone/menaquinone biosynthesis C-methylase UbiE
LTRSSSPEGWHGWDDYASFYDWENARTLGRRDLAFWRTALLAEGARALELGTGTGRLLAPLARAGVELVGVDRSEPMLARARRRIRRLPRSRRPALVRGDIRALPFTERAFGAVMAPYGLLQSLVRESDLAATLNEVARVLPRGGLFSIDLVPDLPGWAEYERRVSLSGRRMAGAAITLVESVRQDRRRGLTIFDEEFTERRGRKKTTTKFALTFRTLTIPQVIARLAAAGFKVVATHGDYRGGPLTLTSDVWIIRARKR